MQTLRLTYFSVTSNEVPNLSQAVSRLNDAGAADVDLTARTRTQLSPPHGDAACNAFIETALKSHVVVITLMAGKQSFPGWDKWIQALEEQKRQGKPLPWFHVQPTGGNAESMEMASQYSRGMDSGIWQQLNQYYRYGGPDNLYHMLVCFYNEIFQTALPLQSPARPPNDGIYHPDLDHVPEPEDYFATLDPARPTLGIWFYQNFWTTGNKAHIDAMIREGEAQGANVICVFHTRFKDTQLRLKGADHVVHRYFMDGNQPRIDALINPVMFSLKNASPDYDGLLDRLNVPVIQALTTSDSVEAWVKSPQGITTKDITIGVAQPELDGVIIGHITAAKQLSGIDPVTGAAMNRYVPIPDRIQALVRLSINWASLRRRPNSDKKVAIVFHQYPPRNDRIGCASGLDTFESIRQILKAMKQHGYHVDTVYDAGDDLLRALMDGMTCDARWCLPEQMAERAKAVAGPDQYLNWHNALPEKVKEKMTQDWGQMPGDLFVHNKELLFPGLINGNLFLTIQPPRGYFNAIDQVYHDHHLSPPHHYLAQYRWMETVFGADVVLHVGKHGSLEWLPGKGVGLSRECFPDLALGSLPNVYIYIINDPGEGTQAKRRASACIVDHLPPVLADAELYEDLAMLDQLILDYQEAGEASKQQTLMPMIWEAVERAEIHLDLDLSRDQAMADVDAFMETLHHYLSEISDTTILKGLHTLGAVPQGGDLVHTLVQLTRLANGEVPSLRASVAAALGFDLDRVLNQRGAVVCQDTGATGARILDRIDAICTEMIRTLIPSMPDLSIDKEMEKHLGRKDDAVSQVLEYVRFDLLPRLQESGDEIDACLNAFEGKFVPPGGSGAPSRGRADLVPAGRNFYSLDPQKIPTPGAWETGKQLANALIQTYQEAHGTYPDSVGMILWASPTMRTKGDDIAQSLYLMGVKPIWHKATANVRDIEVIPLSELGRPRIDVVPKISGIFRDAFPLLTELIDKAVQLVAQLKEPVASNFIRRHVLADMADMKRQGMDDAEAFREASLRIFGAPPGSYGTGITALIETKQWETADDLGKMFIQWSSHGYGKGVNGRESSAAFKRSLKRIQVSVKTQDTREKDMMSCTDFNDYHGGLTAAVTAVRGEAPMALAGDSADPARVVMRSTKVEARHIFRARLLNPKWLEGLKTHGYKGAGDLSKAMDIVFGWDATTGIIEDHMYTRFARKTVLDPDMASWMASVNPHALENMVSKLLEAQARGMWKADDDIIEELTQTYLEVEGEIEAINE